MNDWVNTWLLVNTFGMTLMQLCNEPRRLYLAWKPNTEMTPVPVRSPFLWPWRRMYSIWSKYPCSSQKNLQFFTAIMSSDSSPFLPKYSLGVFLVCMSDDADILTDKSGKMARNVQLLTQRSEESRVNSKIDDSFRVRDLARIEWKTTVPFRHFWACPRWGLQMWQHRRAPQWHKGDEPAASSSSLRNEH